MSQPRGQGAAGVRYVTHNYLTPNGRQSKACHSVFFCATINGGHAAAAAAAVLSPESLTGEQVKMPGLR